MAEMESCSALRVATPVSNLATSGPVSSASDHFLSVRSRMLVASYQTEAEMISCLSVLSKESGADEASKTSGSDFEHIKEYVGNEYAAEWYCNLKKVDNLSEVYSSVAMTSSEVESVEASVGEPDGMWQMIHMEPLIGGVELMMEREGVIDGEKELLCLVTIVFWRKSKED
jgi:hypothetical protein